MNKTIRYSVFIISSILFYVLWINGGEQAYGKIILRGMEQFSTQLSNIEQIELKHFEKEEKTMLYFTYSDRKNSISLEYCLPIVLLLAWQFSLFIDRSISTKLAFKLFAINFIIVFILQITFPLLLFNVSLSKPKAISLFIGLQTFSFIILFLILKDTLILNHKNKLINNDS